MDGLHETDKIDIRCVDEMVIKKRQFLERPS
jgi:hypothetical protein